VRYPSKWVHINPPYWQSDAKYWYDYSDQVMRATTLTHEYMHLNGTHTDPEVYGHKNCLDLAKSNPKKAGENAESHAYFAVEQKYFKPTVDRLAAESYVNPSVPGSAQHDFDTDPALGAIQ